mmetsp:Transcript_30941/g.76959  ORF Transcript_30941/g.76959 Transcript_30941/m.76959 type:complete len:127 (+) Transcript_30941:454-834(+)
MSAMSQTQRQLVGALRRLATTSTASAVQTRAYAILPSPTGKKQDLLKSAAERMDFFGEQQEIDTRYALLNEARIKAKKIEERFRAYGKGYKNPWDENPALVGQMDSHLHGKAEKPTFFTEKPAKEE